MNGHPQPEELADAAEGLLERTRAAEVSTHLSDCPTCRGTTTALEQVRATLAAAPRPAMPAAVTARLAGVVAAELRARGTEPAARAVPARRSSSGSTRISRSLGSYASRLPAPRRSPWRSFALAAAVAGAVLGGGGYLLGAGDALREPSTAPVAVAADDLGATAGELIGQGQVQPQRFTPAWTCARRAVPDPITGVTEVRVGRQPALLVVAEADTGPQAVLVIGCETGVPVRVLTAPIPP